MYCKKQCQCLDSLMERIPFKGAAYRHYKGGLYIVLGFCMNTETKEVLVLYRKRSVNVIWARPWKSWFSKTAEGYTRFKREKQYDLGDNYDGHENC